MDFPIGFVDEIDGTVGDQHRYADEAAQQGKGVEQPKKSTIVKKALPLVEVIRHPHNCVPDRHTKE